MAEQAQEGWRSRKGFILAAVGSAVGLGNIWRFSFVAGENGGATFLLVYILCVILIGLPIVLAETTIGRRTGRDAVGAYLTLAPGTPWVAVGALAVLAGFIILSYYSVVAGWVLKYALGAISGTLWENKDAYGAYFSGFIANPWEPVLWQGVMMAATIGIVVGGVEHGIERACRILLPLLGLIVVVLAIYSLTLPGSGAGLSFFFKPDWSVLGSSKVYLAAMGQAFFSLSLGMGVYATYGAYLSKSHRIPGAAAAVATGDTLVAIIAGIAILPAVFAFGMDPKGGPTLAFITLPKIFLAMPGGVAFGIAFFLLLVFGALTSMVSLLEVTVAYALRKFGWGRVPTTALIGLAIFVIGVPASLGFGIWSDITIGGKGILDAMDFVAANILLPLGGLASALFVGWRWSRADALTHSDFGESRFGIFWLWSIRTFVPALILLIFLHAVGLI